MSRTFLLGFVRQHRSECDVADAPDVLLRGRELIINNNAASVVKLDACSLDVQTINIRAAADSDEDDIRIQLTQGQSMLNKRKTHSYCFFLATLGWLCLEIDLAVSLLSGNNLGVELEFETLFCQHPLELLTSFKSVTPSKSTRLVLTQPPRRYPRHQYHPRTPPRSLQNQVDSKRYPSLDQ